MSRYIEVTFALLYITKSTKNSVYETLFTDNVYEMGRYESSFAGTHGQSVYEMTFVKVSTIRKYILIKLFSSFSILVEVLISRLNPNLKYFSVT